MAKVCNKEFKHIEENTQHEESWRNNTDVEESGRNKKGYWWKEWMWTQGWTTVQCDGSFHTVTNPSDNHTSETHVMEYTHPYSHMLYSLMPQLISYTKTTSNHGNVH